MSTRASLLLVLVAMTTTAFAPPRATPATSVPVSAPTTARACLGVTYKQESWTNDNQYAWSVVLSNGCSQRVWFKACFVNARGEWRRDSGFVEPYETKSVYLLTSGSRTRGSFTHVESATSSGSYPYQCAIR